MRRAGNRKRKRLHRITQQARAGKSENMTIDEAIAKFENTVLYESLGILPKHEENQIALDALREKKEREND